MSATIEGTAEELLKGKNFCHVATLRADGTIHGVPVWVDIQDGQPVLNTAEGRAWPRNLRADRLRARCRRARRAPPSEAPRVAILLL